MRVNVIEDGFIHLTTVNHSIKDDNYAVYFER